MNKRPLFKDIKPNNRTNFELLYYHFYRRLILLEKQIYRDCEQLNKPTFIYNIHLKRMKEKITQMASKYKSTQ